MVSCQDLKEKKLAEEKENGKDASTNGKVTPPPPPSGERRAAAHT